MSPFKGREKQKVSCHPQKLFAKEQNPIKTFHHCEHQKKYGSMLTLHCCSFWKGKELEKHFCLYSHYFFRESAEINSFDLWLMYGFITCDEAFGWKQNIIGQWVVFREFPYCLFFQGPAVLRMTRIKDFCVRNQTRTIYRFPLFRYSIASMIDVSCLSLVF